MHVKMHTVKHLPQAYMHTIIYNTMHFIQIIVGEQPSLYNIHLHYVVNMIKHYLFV